METSRSSRFVCVYVKFDKGVFFLLLFHLDAYSLFRSCFPDSFVYEEKKLALLDFCMNMMRFYLFNIPFSIFHQKVSRADSNKMSNKMRDIQLSALHLLLRHFYDQTYCSEFILLSNVIANNNSGAICWCFCCPSHAQSRILIF